MTKPRPGEQRLKEAIRRRQQRPPTRDSDPKPYDENWGWWMERRLENLENGQKWLIRLAAGILLADIIRTLL